MTKYMKIAGCIVACVAIALCLAGMILTNGESQHLKEMSDHLNEKYGYEVTPENFIYFRAEDHSYHKGFWSAFRYEIPNIAIFSYEGRNITVTEEDGFLGDDVQLPELNDLICGYFEKTLGTRPEYVEIYIGISYSGILLQHYNEKLSSDNIDAFMQKVWDVSGSRLRVVFYFKAAEDIDAQVELITQQLATLRSHGSIASVSFYITQMDNLEVFYNEPIYYKQNAKKNAEERDISYICGGYHVVNPIEHHYMIGGVWEETIAEKGLYNNTFVTGGQISFAGNLLTGFGNRKTKAINGFRVAQLHDADLQTHLSEMVSYGKCREFTILFDAGDESKVSSLKITNGEKFCWDYRWKSGPVQIYEYSHGQLQDLKTAYDCGRLSHEDMDRILEQHKAHYEDVFNEKYD